MGENGLKPSNDKSKLVPGVGRIPFPAYQGKDPYIFISYAHVDHDRVFSMIREYYDRGYNIWYDEGIAPGNEWTADIAKALKDCALFVVMITPNSVKSANCKNEINFAISKKKPFIAIHLEPTTLPDDLELQIGMKQAILKYTMTHEEYVYKYTNAFGRFGINPDEKAAERRMIARTAQGEEGEEEPGLEPEKKKKKPILAAAVGIALAAAAFLGLMLNQGKDTKKAEESTHKIEVTYETTEAQGADEGQAADTAAGKTGKAAATGSDDYLYSQKYNGITLDKYAGKDQAVVVVPEEIDGIPVTTIGETCFEKHNEIEEIVLPDTITTIQYRAFGECLNLKKINVPPALERVAGWAFTYTEVEEMVFPDTLTKFEYGNFNSCNKLKTVVLPESITFIDKDTFRSCPMLEKVTIPAKDIEIDIKAFDSEARGLTLCGAKGSYTEKYAAVMGFTFEEYKK